MRYIVDTPKQVHDHCTREQGGDRTGLDRILFYNGYIVGISELIVVLVVALIIIPPEELPEVMRTVGKILRELRLASNTVVRELTEAVDDPFGLRQPPAAIAKPPITKPPPATSSSPPPAPPGTPASQS